MNHTSNSEWLGWISCMPRASSGQASRWLVLVLTLKLSADLELLPAGKKFRPGGTYLFLQFSTHPLPCRYTSAAGRSLAAWLRNQAQHNKHRQERRHGELEKSKQQKKIAPLIMTKNLDALGIEPRTEHNSQRLRSVNHTTRPCTQYTDLKNQWIMWLQLGAGGVVGRPSLVIRGSGCEYPRTLRNGSRPAHRRDRVPWQAF